MRILFSGGGTAGHVLPNLALIRELKAEHEILYIGSDGPEKLLMERAGIPYARVSCGKFRRYRSWKNFTDVIKIPVGFFQAVSVVKRFRPDVLFVKGGYVSIPAACAGYFCGVPVILHESDVSPGLANRIIAQFAKCICLTFDESRRFFPEHNIAVTGNPIRKEILAGNREKGLRFLGFEGNKPVIGVMGGSLGAQIINELVSGSLTKLLPACDIVHIAGPGKISETSLSGYRSFEYLDTELPDVYAASDLIIGRAGAGMITELLAIEKPMILFPLPKNVSRGEQFENADIMEKIGVASVIREKITPQRFSNIILDHLQAPERLMRMKHSAYAYGQKMRMATHKIIEILTAINSKAQRRQSRTLRARSARRNIGINGRFLAYPHTGIGQYTYGLLSALANIDRENEYTIVVPAPTRLNLQGRFNLKILPEPNLIFSGVKKTVWEQKTVPDFFRAHKVDLIHSFYPSLPWRKFPIPWIVTVHDVIPWKFPEYTPTFLSRKYHQKMLANLSRAKAIVTVSEFSKQQISKIADFPAGKIFVIPNAAAEHFSVLPTQAEIARTLQKFGLTSQEFFLYVGGFDARKNVDRLVEAFEKSVASHHKIKLALVGHPPKHLQRQALYKSYEKCLTKAKNGHIIMTDFVREDELNILYRSAKAFVNFSLFEGFNIPVVEAATCHAPLLLSDIPVHREIAKSFAAFANPHDVDAMANLFSRAAENPEFTRDLAEKTAAIAHQFSWTASAQSLLSLYASSLH